MEMDKVTAHSINCGPDEECAEMHAECIHFLPLDLCEWCLTKLRAGDEQAIRDSADLNRRLWS